MSAAALPSTVPAAERPRPAAPRASWWRRWRSTALGFASLVMLALLWQLASALRVVNPLFLPPPGAVATSMAQLVASGELWYHLGISGEELLYGLAISIVVGAVLGILTGWYDTADEFLRPVVTGLNSMPHVAVIPVLILIFGIGLAPKIVIVVLSCAVTILLNTAAGVRNVDPQLMTMSRSFGARDLQAIRTVVLPSMIPFFMTGVRISVGRALIAVVVSEFFASKAGIGNLMIAASNAFNMPRMYALLFIITGLGIALTQGASWLERRLQRWRD